MAPTAASLRPGGKFASLAANTNIPRGKFANIPQPTSAPNTSTTTLLPITSSSSPTAPSSPRTIRAATLSSKRARLKTHPIFDELDEAERLVLDLLALSSSSAASLSQLSVPRSMRGREGGEAGSGVGDEDLIGRIQKNGRDYVAKLDRIYSLLEPRAGLVVSYGNLTGAGKKPAGVGGGGEREGGNQNMYSSRLEMRLAIERRDLMKELLRLERQDADCGQGDAAASAASAGSNKVDSVQSDITTTTKRKREGCE